MSGVDNMNYMYSVNANNGLMRMFVNFDLKTDPNIDHVLTPVALCSGRIAAARRRCETLASRFRNPFPRR